MFWGGTFDSNSFFEGGILDSLSLILKCFRGHIWGFYPQKVRNHNIYVIRDKSAYATSQMCPLKQLCAPTHGCRGWHFIQPGTGVWKKKYLKSVLQGFFHGFLPKVERVRREVRLFIYISFQHFFRLGIYSDTGSCFIQFLAGVWVDGMVVGCLGGAHGQRGLQGHGSLQVTRIKYLQFTFSLYII